MRMSSSNIDELYRMMTELEKRITRLEEEIIIDDGKNRTFQAETKVWMERLESMIDEMSPHDFTQGFKSFGGA